MAVFRFMLGMVIQGILVWNIPLGWSQQAPPSDDDVQALPTMIVTANRIEESSDEVPIPLTILQEQDLKDRKIYRLDDLFLQIPNLYNSPLNQGTRRPNFRGLNPSFFTGQSPVTLMVDGMPIGQMRALSLNLSNVEQVEVLRGAQNTLFGQNAIGGVINVTTRKPSDTVSAQTEVFAGSRNTYHGTLTYNTPLIKETLYAGLSYTHHRTSGFLKNTFPGNRRNFNDQRENQLNLNFHWLPTTQYSARLLLTYDDRNNGQHTVGSQGALDNRLKHVSLDTNGHSDFNNKGVTLGQKYYADAFDLIATTSLLSLHRDFLWDQDTSSGNVFDNRPLDLLFDNLTITQELRAQSQPQSTVKWNLGGYYEYDNRDVNQSFPNSAANDTHLESRRQKHLGAVFGQFRVPVTKKGGITIGSRVQLTYKDFKNRIFSGQFFDATPDQVPTIQRVKDTRTFFAFLPKIALDYEVAKNIRFFASYARGHLPGGFNYFTIGAHRSANRFKAQKSNDYEVGLKTRWFDQRLQFNVNLFYLDIKDTHAFEFQPSGGILASNAGKSTNKGVEVESVAKITSWLTLDAAIGIVSAEYDDYDAGGFGDFSGNYIQNTPTHTIHMGLQARQQPFMARIDWHQTGSVFFDNANTLKQSTYDIVNLRVGYEMDAVSAYVTVDNLMDTEYAVRALITTVDPSVSFGTPRTFGGIVRMNF